MSEGNTSNQVEDLKYRALQELESASDAEQLEAWRVAYLGRRGELTQVLRSLGSLPADERRAAGAPANAIRSALEQGLEDRELQIKRAAAENGTAGEAIDVTLPGWPTPRGGLHPTTRIVRDICNAFTSMGFSGVEGAEVEWGTYLALIHL